MKNELGHFRLLMFTTCRYDTNFSINLYTFGKHIHVYWKKFIINKKNKTTKMFCKQKLHAKLAKLRSWNIKRERKWLMNIWSERPKGGNLIIACTSQCGKNKNSLSLEKYFVKSMYLLRFLKKVSISRNFRQNLRQ